MVAVVICAVKIKYSQNRESIMWRIAALVIVALYITPPVQAKSEIAHQGYPHERGDQSTLDQHHAFSPAERNLIRAHLLGRQPAFSQEKGQDLPPGLQKKAARGKALPPGWQDKVAPGHSLDYQVYRHGESLPDSLLRRLPPPPVGTEILQVQNKVVLINAATRTILDAFDLTPTP